jgi:hypothetical protein
MKELEVSRRSYPLSNTNNKSRQDERSLMVKIILFVALMICVTVLIAGISKVLEIFYFNEYVRKTAVRDCFKDVVWNVQSFSVNEMPLLTDKLGNSKFYAVKDIDEAIERLNKLLSGEVKK